MSLRPYLVRLTWFLAPPGARQERQAFEQAALAELAIASRYHDDSRGSIYALSACMHLEAQLTPAVSRAGYRAKVVEALLHHFRVLSASADSEVRYRAPAVGSLLRRYANIDPRDL